MQHYKVTIYLYPVCSWFYVSVYTVDSKTLMTKKKKKLQCIFTEEVGMVGMLVFYRWFGNPGKMVTFFLRMFLAVVLFSDLFRLML